VIFQTLYWHWLVFGMVLVLSELVVPNFTIVWFGLAAIVVSILMLLVPGLSFTWQLFAWAVASCILTILWLKLVKPRMVDRTKAGIAREALIGQTGQVIKAPIEGRNGVLRFTVPLLGSDEWSFFCDQSVQPGDRVVVNEISGNTLIVRKGIGGTPTPSI
jgi:membrane protein implicated in regulation of membrane protease activity